MAINLHENALLYVERRKNSIMKYICTKTVVEYRYESEEEATEHEKVMKIDGWSVESYRHYLIKHFRSYSQTHREGAFL